jgi:two-component system, cell cycle response regulator
MLAVCEACVRWHDEGVRVPGDAVTLVEAEQMLRQDARAALRCARQILETTDEAGAGGTYQRWLLLKGAAQARLGDTEDGARLMREVRDWAEQHEDTALLASSHRQLSALFRRVGDPALMLEHAVIGVNLLEEYQVPVEDAVRADHLLGLADALGASGSYQESIARYYEAAKLADGCSDVYLQTAALNNLAYTQYEAGSVTEAVAAAELLREKVALSGQPMRTHFADTIARAYAAAGRYAEAVETIEPLCSAPDTGDDCDALVLALLTVAEVRRLAGDYDQAQSALYRSATLAEKYALSGRVIDTLREQAELHAARGDYRKAFVTHQAFYLADLELRAMERDSRARTLNAIFEATEARRTSDHFRELSGRDPLTGLHNRRHLDEELQRLLGLVDTDGCVLTVGLIDLDHFKRVNDTVSHAVGDEVLRRVAVMLHDAVAGIASGLAARMGGEEFLLLLPGLPVQESVDRLEELRMAIAGHPWVEVTGGLPVTASIGVASAPGDATERGALLARADENLYRAKRAGRDRVIA